MNNFFDDDDDEPENSPINSHANESANFFEDSFLASPSRSPRASTSNILNHNDSASSTSYRASSLQRRDADTSRRGFSPSLDDILAAGDDDLDEYDPDGLAGLLRGSGKRESNVKRLLRCLNNEIGAPEVLRFPRALVERVVKDLARRKEMFEDQNALVGQKESHYVKWALIATENMRAAHILKSFLRQRIYKIEKFARYYLQDEHMEDTLERLHHNEIEHARGYRDLCDTYFNTSSMDAMPERVRGLNDPNMIPNPDLSTAVFLRVRKDCGIVVIPNGQTLELEEGTQHMLRYSTIKRFLEEDKVELI